MDDATDWKRAHEELLKLAAQRTELDAKEGRWLLAALRAEVHVRLGYGSFQEYVERLFGYGPRFVAERLRVAHALEALPSMMDAHRGGTLSWSAVRELTRVATAETEKAWIDAAQGKSLRQLERLVAGREPGDTPTDAPTGGAQRHVLRVEVSAETWATYREAVAKLRRDAGGPIDEDAAVLLMARQVLTGPKDAGASSYQVALTVCEMCGQGHQHGRGEAVTVSAEVVEMAACDARVFSLEPSSGDPRARAEVAPDDDETGLRAKQQMPEGNRGATLSGRRRAKQTIPPAVRRAVLHRDHGRCLVAGCRNGTFVDVHHVIPRAEGGKHEIDSLMTVCSAHHRALHRGTLIMEGRPSLGLRFLHADGTLYGGAAEPAATEANEEAFLALRTLGFSETVIRHALETVKTSIEEGANTHVGLLTRAALRVLTPPATYASGRTHTPGGSTAREAQAIYLAETHAPRRRGCELRAFRARPAA